MNMRLIMESVCAGLIAVAFILVCAGFHALGEGRFHVAGWFIVCGVIVALAMALTFVVRWIQMDDERRKRSNLRSFPGRQAS